MSILWNARGDGLRVSVVIAALPLAVFLLFNCDMSWADMSMYNGETTPPTEQPPYHSPPSAINGPMAPTRDSTLGNNATKSDDHHDNWNHDYDPDRTGPVRDVNPYATPIFVAPFPPNCGPTTVIVCKTPVTIPYSGTIGSTYSVALPYPYTNRTFSVQCTNFDGAISYQVVDPGEISCAYPICADSSISVCGTEIPVSGGTHLGDKTDVPLPSSIVDAVTASSTSLTATCVDGPDGKPFYQLEDTSKVSCNAFPCADSTVRLCGTSVAVKGGAQMGEVVHMTMPAPFAKDPFDVACLGTLGAQASYQLSDSSAVTCNIDPTRAP